MPFWRPRATYKDAGDWLTSGGDLAVGTPYTILSPVTGEPVLCGYATGTPTDAFEGIYVPSEWVDIGAGLTLASGNLAAFSRDGNNKLVASLDVTNQGFVLDLDFLGARFGSVDLDTIVTVTLASDPNLGDGAKFWTEWRNEDTPGDFFREVFEALSADWKEAAEWNFGATPGNGALVAVTEGTNNAVGVYMSPNSAALQTYTGSVQKLGFVSTAKNGVASKALFDGTDTGDLVTSHCGANVSDAAGASDILVVTIHGWRQCPHPGGYGP